MQEDDLCMLVVLIVFPSWYIKLFISDSSSLAHLSAQLWNSKHNFFGFCWILNPQEQGMTFQKSNKCYNFLLTHKPHMSSKENKPKYFFFKTKKKIFLLQNPKKYFSSNKIISSKLMDWCWLSLVGVTHDNPKYLITICVDLFLSSDCLWSPASYSSTSLFNSWSFNVVIANKSRRWAAFNQSAVMKSVWSCLIFGI